MTEVTECRFEFHGSGCDTCVEKSGLYSERPSRPHGNCSCPITELDPESGRWFTADPPPRDEQPEEEEDPRDQEPEEEEVDIEDLDLDVPWPDAPSEKEELERRVQEMLKDFVDSTLPDEDPEVRQDILDKLKGDRDADPHESYHDIELHGKKLRLDLFPELEMGKDRRPRIKRLSVKIEGKWG